MWAVPKPNLKYRCQYGRLHQSLVRHCSHPLRLSRRHHRRCNCRRSARDCRVCLALRHVTVGPPPCSVLAHDCLVSLSERIAALSRGIRAASASADTGRAAPSPVGVVTVWQSCTPGSRSCCCLTELHTRQSGPVLSDRAVNPPAGAGTV